MLGLTETCDGRSRLAMGVAGTRGHGDADVVISASAAARGATATARLFMVLMLDARS
jgi:hypothetical protein